MEDKKIFHYEILQLKTRNVLATERKILIEIMVTRNVNQLSYILNNIPFFTNTFLLRL